MTASFTTETILKIHILIQEAYPDDIVRGHIHTQAIDTTVTNALREFAGRPIHDTIFKQAAVLLEGIIRLHPFPDGNKRTALLAAWAFLFHHDHLLIIPPYADRFALNIAQDESRSEEENGVLMAYVAIWLEEWTAGDLVRFKRLTSKANINPDTVLKSAWEVYTALFAA